MSSADDPSEENEDHASEPLLPKIITGAAVAAAGVRLGPESAVALGALSPVFEKLIGRALEELRGDAQKRAAVMLATIAEDTGGTDEDVARMIGASESTRLLTGLALDATQRTDWPPKVQALGRALKDGLLTADQDKVDVQRQAIDVMADLERLHVVLLELLVRYQPEVQAQAWVAESHQLPSYQNRFMGGDRPDNPKDWTRGKRIWTVDQIVAVRPELKQVVSLLLGTLTTNGLVSEVDSTSNAIKQFGAELTKQVNREAQKPQQGRVKGRPLVPQTLQNTRLRGIEPKWAPTEWGETILSYYELAGTAETPGDAPQG